MEYKDDWEKLEVEMFKEDKELSVICLNDEIEEYNRTGDMKYLNAQLKLMATAYGWTRLERETGLTRATLYNTLNNKSEPKLKTFLSILNVLGLNLTVKPCQQNTEN